MDRETIKKILGESATDEQVTSVLNALHNQSNTLKTENENLKNSINKYSDYDDIKKELDEFKKAKMTEQEKLEQAKKEIAENLRQSKLIKNKAKVMQELAGLDIDEEIIDSIVGEDETLSISKAQKLASKFNSVIESTKTKTQQELATTNVKPNISNANPNEGMTWEKFTSMSASEQAKFQEEHPQEFENL